MRRFLFAIATTMTLTLTLAIMAISSNVACGLACQKDDSRCAADGIETCNTERDGWTQATPCHVAAFPSSHCVTLDDHTATCSITGAPIAKCTGTRAVVCAEGALAHCFRGHGAPPWTSCATCIDGTSESTCGGSDAGTD